MSEEIEIQEEILEEEETQEEAEQEVVEEEETIDWEARAKKAEATIQKNKHKAKAKPIKNIQGNSEQLERMQLQIDGYPAEMVDQIMELGGKAFLNNPIGKKTVDAMLEQHRAEQATEIESGTQTSFEKKYTPADLKDKSIEELEKILPKADE